MHEEFLLFSCSCPLLTLAQHCKRKQIPNLKSRPKPERKTVVLSCEVYQEENKRTVASEDIFPLHLENKLFSYQTHLFNTESRWPGAGGGGRGNAVLTNTHKNLDGFLISLFPGAARFCARQEPSKSRKACHVCKYLLVVKEERDLVSQNLSLKNTVV